MDVQSLAFRTDLALLRLSGSEIDDRGSHIVVRTPDNPDYRWGNFYLLARPPGADEVEALLASYDAEFPDSQHRAFGVDGIEDQRAALSPLAAVVPGIDVATVMTATAVHPPPRPNTEATYRPLASDDDWAQRLEMSLVVHDNETDLDLHREFAIKRALADRGLHEAGHGAWWGAFVGDRLASVMGLVTRAAGWPATRVSRPCPTTEVEASPALSCIAWPSSASARWAPPRWSWWPILSTWRSGSTAPSASTTPRHRRSSSSATGPASRLGRGGSRRTAPVSRRRTPPGACR